MNNQSGCYILLAAGFSRRFGSPKLLYKLPSGESIIQASVTCLKESGRDFVVAVRENDATLTSHLNDMNVSLIPVANAEEGLSSVIAETITKLDLSAKNWVGICLGDMPYIRSHTLSNMPNHVSASAIVRPRYHDKLGHPVVFGSDYFGELKTLSGDNGAKAIIKRYPGTLNIIDIDDSMILYDIDTPENVLV